MKNSRTKNMTTMAMLAALAFLVMLVGRIPMVAAAPFLKYDPKDVIIIIGGFIFGPFAAFMISLVVSIIEMLTVSETGPIGAIMNLLSTCSFACLASVIYKKKHSIKGAVVGLVSGIALMVVVMLAWNYLLTPIYMGYPREAVAAMLLPVFLPFNLIKGGLNAGITLLIYKPVVMTLRKAGLAPKSTAAASAGNADSAEANGQKQAKKLGAIVTLTAILLLSTCVLFALVLAGII